MSIWQALRANVRAWWQRHVTQGQLRFLQISLVFVVLYVLGPTFLTLPIFPERATAITSTATDGSTCRYDADLEPSSAATRSVVTGQSVVLSLNAINSGSCSWNADLTLRLESGNLPEAVATIPAKETGSGATLGVSVPITVPSRAGVYNAVYRMRAPDGRSFGAPLTLSIYAHAEGASALPPAESLFSLGNVIRGGLLLVPALVGLYAAVSQCGRFVRALYGLKNEMHGWTWLWSHLFGWSFGRVATIKDGQLDAPGANETVRLIGGPGTLTVPAGVVALLERGGGFSRIVGPGKVELAPFERLRAVVDGRPLSRKKEETLYTRDGIEVKTDTILDFKLMQGKEGERVLVTPVRTPWWRLLTLRFGFRVKPSGAPGALPVSPDTVRAIVYELPVPLAWEATISTGIVDKVPDMVLDDLWAPDDTDRQHKPRRELVDELFTKAKEDLKKRGIDLLDIRIGPFWVPEEVARTQREYWSTRWEKISRITLADGEAGALRRAQTARAEAQAELVQAIAQSFRMMNTGGTALPSHVVAKKMLEVIARTMKATLEESAALEPSDKALLILKRLENIVGS